jgi:hypothetical protein
MARLMTMRVLKILMVVLVLAALRAEAAITITPASPTSQDPITAVIDVTAGCGEIITTSVSGSLIRTDIVQLGCVHGPPVSTIPVATQFGPLAAGTYTYDVFLDFEHTGPVLFFQRTIVVAPAIPALSELGLVILAMSLAGAACFVIGRHG